MISVGEAKKIIFDNCRSIGAIQLSCDKALSHVLAESVKSPIDMPPFDQSAMDGYAVSNNQLNQGDIFKLVGEQPAGVSKNLSLNKGEAIRIFTGAILPANTSHVIMQEKIEAGESEIKLFDTPSSNSNIRSQGEQIKAGDIALEKDSLLNPAAVSYLKTLGVQKVNVYKKPICAIFVTGDELIQVGEELKDGQIYESNSSAIRTAAYQSMFDANHIVFLPDNLEQSIDAINEAIDKVDVLIFSGGISVGKYDLVSEALKKCGLQTHFYKVKQKPGKPMLFGTLKDKPVFALPGNPAAALTCFYEYVLPALKKISGYSNYEMTKLTLPSNSEFKHNGMRAQFLKARHDGASVELLDRQSSAMMGSYALANCIVYIPQEVKEVKQGDLIETHLLPSH